MPRIFILIFTLFIVTSCSHMQATHDYNPGVDFSKLKTFTILYDHTKGTKTLMKDRIAQALKNELLAKGFRQVARDQADFWVVFHTNVTTRNQIMTDYQRIGVYPYYRRMGPMVPVQREYMYTEGKLVVDAMDPKDKAILWRGKVTDRLPTLKTPQERMKYIQKAVKEVLKDFPPPK